MTDTPEELLASIHRLQDEILRLVTRNTELATALHDMLTLHYEMMKQINHAPGVHWVWSAELTRMLLETPAFAVAVLGETAKPAREGKGDHHG